MKKITLFVLIGFLFFLSNSVFGEGVIVDWTSTYSYSTGRGHGIAVDTSGNVYVTGYENRSDLGQHGNIWTRKYDTNGNEIWTSTYNSPDNSGDYGYGIAVDSSGNVYVTGYERRSDLGQSDNIWTRKYDPNGFEIWTSTYNSPNNAYDYGYGIAVDSSGNVYVTGTEYRTDLGQYGNIWTRKYDSNGYEIWTSTYNSPDNNNRCQVDTFTLLRLPRCSLSRTLIRGKQKLAMTERDRYFTFVQYDDENLSRLNNN